MPDLFTGSVHNSIIPDAGPSIKNTIGKQVLGCFQAQGFSSNVIWRTPVERALDSLGSETSTEIEEYHDTPLTVIFSGISETENTFRREEGLVDYGRIRAFILPNQRYPDTDRKGIGWPHRLIKSEDLIFRRVRDEAHIFYLDPNLDKREFHLQHDEILENSEHLYYYHSLVSDGNKVDMVKDIDYTIDYKNGKVTITKIWPWNSVQPKPLNSTVYVTYDFEIYIIDAINDRTAYRELILKKFHY